MILAKITKVKVIGSKVLLKIALTMLSTLHRQNDR